MAEEELEAIDFQERQRCAEIVMAVSQTLAAQSEADGHKDHANIASNVGFMILVGFGYQPDYIKSLYAAWHARNDPETANQH